MINGAKNNLSPICLNLLRKVDIPPFVIFFSDHIFLIYTSIVADVFIWEEGLLFTCIFSFSKVIFVFRIILKLAIDLTNIKEHYLFLLYCSIVLVETFPVCRVAGWVGGWINWNYNQLSPTWVGAGAELGNTRSLQPWTIYVTRKGYLSSKLCPY